MNTTDLQAIINAIKDVDVTLKSSTWWGLVQDEVKERFEIVLNNLIVLGPIFKETFISAFKYEHARRMIEGESVKTDLPGAFGSTMTEEAYRCGIEPTRLVLHLHDWILPNDADVQACMDFCHKMEELESHGILGSQINREDRVAKEKKWKERLQEMVAKNSEIPKHLSE